jgi:hypothetical protein
VPVKTAWFSVGVGEFNEDLDGIASGVYGKTNTLPLEAGLHVVRVVAAFEFSLLYGRSQVLLNGAVPSPPVWSFNVSHVQVPGSAPLRPIWNDVGVCKVFGLVMRDGKTHPVGLPDSGDIGIEYHARVTEMNSPRSDGSLLDSGHSQTYTIGFQADRMPAIGDTGHIRGTSSGTLRVLAEYNSLFP